MSSCLRGREESEGEGERELDSLPTSAQRSQVKQGNMTADTQGDTDALPTHACVSSIKMCARLDNPWNRPQSCVYTATLFSTYGTLLSAH